MTCLIMWESFLTNRRIKKFPVLSTVRVSTNSQSKAARYWTLTQAKWNPSISPLHVYSYLCLVFILSPSVARSLKLSLSFKISDEINSRTTHLCCTCYVTGPWLHIWYYQVYHLQFLVTWCTSIWTLNSFAFCLHSEFIIFLRISEPRTNISLHRWLIVFITETESVYFSIRTKYVTVIEVCIRVGMVNIIWWVGLVGYCKGMKTPLDSAKQQFNWLHGAESFPGSEYTPYTFIE